MVETLDQADVGFSDLRGDIGLRPAAWSLRRHRHEQTSDEAGVDMLRLQARLEHFRLNAPRQAHRGPIQGEDRLVAGFAVNDQRTAPMHLDPGLHVGLATGVAVERSEPGGQLIAGQQQPPRIIGVNLNDTLDGGVADPIAPAYRLTRPGAALVLRGSGIGFEGLVVGGHGGVKGRLRLAFEVVDREQGRVLRR